MLLPWVVTNPWALQVHHKSRVSNEGQGAGPAEGAVGTRTRGALVGLALMLAAQVPVSLF